MLYILNSDIEVIGTLTSKGSTTKATPYFDDEFLMDLATGAETFSFSVFAQTPQAQALQAGNFVAFQYKEEYKLFQIINTQETHSRDFIKSVYCEMAGIELLNNIVRPVSFPSVSVKQFLTRILADTDWEIGNVDSRLAEVHTIELKEYSSVYNLLQTHVIGTFGAEISFTVDIKGGQVVAKKVNVYAERGDFEGFRFDYDRNVSEVVKQVDSSELATALIGVGKNNIDFKTVEAPDKPLNQDFIGDEEAYQQWNKNGAHILGVYKCDSESPAELLKLTRQELQKRKNPKITYSLKVALIDDSLSLGDTVYIVDNEFTPALHLSGRVSKLKVSFTDPNKNECQLANFKEVVSKITDADRLIASIIDEKFPIGGSDIQNGAINGDKLQDGAVNRPQIIQRDMIITDHIQTDTIKADQIKADQIHSTHISANAIETKHITAEAVDAKHIKADAINATHIQADSIGADELQANSIITEHIRAGQVVSDHILAGQIKADHMTANSVSTGALQAGSVATDKLQAGAVTTDKLDANSVTADKVNAGAITTDKLFAGAVTADKLGVNSVTAEKVLAGEIKADHIASLQIKTDHLQAGAVNADKLSANAVTAGKINAGAVEASHIKGGSIEAGHLSAGEIITNSAQIKQGIIGTAHIGKGQITSAQIGEAQITSAHILDGTISSAEIGKAQIGSAHIQSLAVEDGHIKNLNAEKINAGKINTGLVEVSGTNGKLKIKDNRLQVFDTQPIPVERVSVGDVNGDGTVYGFRVRGADGQTTLYDESGVYEEGITDGAITNPKISENAVDSRTLNLDELFVKDSAFVSNLNAVEIKAEQITTGKIDSERLDITGLVGFEALNPDLSNSFIVPEGSDKTFINGGNILTNSVTAEQINAKGLTVTDSNNAPTFTIDNEGEVSISGEVVSSNFSDAEGEEAGYRITKDGDAVFNQATIRGNVILPNAGITRYEESSSGANLFKDAGKEYPKPDREFRGVLITDLAKKYLDHDITVSFDLKVEGNAGNVNVYALGRYLIGFSQKLSPAPSLTEWTRYTLKGHFSYNASPDPNGETCQLSFYGNYDSGVFPLVKNIKIELGHKDHSEFTPFYDLDNPVRFWAGTSYENREKAPFLVYQNGKIKATEGEFGGTFTGSLDIGNIHIKDTNDSQASFKINTNNEAETVIELTDTYASLNTDVNLGNMLTITKSTEETTLKGSLDLTPKTVKNSGMSLNELSGNNYILQQSHNKDGGKHKVYYKDGQGGLTFESSGSSSITGSNTLSDFTFARSSGDAEVRVEGELTVSQKIKMEEANKIEMVSITTVGNSGIDFMLK